MSFETGTLMCAYGNRAKYSSIRGDKEDDDTQLEMLEALSKIACAGSQCLEQRKTDSQRWQTLKCTLCDTLSKSNRDGLVYWNSDDGEEDWKEVIAALLVITKESTFQKSSKARILMAVAIGRAFNHISNSRYLNLETCELGQWLLSSMSRSLRELKLAAT